MLAMVAKCGGVGRTCNCRPAVTRALGTRDVTDVLEHRSTMGAVVPARYVFAVLSSVGFAIIYGLKVNLSVVIVTMVNHTAIASDSVRNSSAQSSSGCPESTKGHQEDGPFEWNETLQGLILGSYFWGYLVGQLPGGRMAEVYSGKWVMLAASILNIGAALLSPISCYIHYSFFIFLRVLQGLGGGFTFPAMHVLIAHWAPPSERSIITGIIYAGTSLGTVISMLMSGWIAASFGWEWVFYIMGILSIVWCILWVFLVQDTPEKQRFMTDEERTFIKEALKTTVSKHANPPVPWKKVLTSGPFLAILISHLCGNVGWYMLLTQLPSYMKQILKFQIKENAILSSLPFFCMWIFCMGLSKVVDTLRSHNRITTGVARKICTGIASIGPCTCFIIVCFVGCNKIFGVAMITLSTMTIGGMFCGYLANHIDIAPNFAGTLMAITNTIATIPGITVPIIVGYLTQGNQTIERWRFVFFGTSGIYIVLFVVYTFFGSGEEQPWNKIESSSTEEPQDETK